MMRGHRTSILGAGVTRSSPVQVDRHASIDKPRWIHRAVSVARRAHYLSPPEWREGPGDPNIKRKWLMHIEDERAGDWKLGT